ncbi:MAG: hypothetical protein ACRCTG_16695 [Aestuariivirga sp.]
MTNENTLDDGLTDEERAALADDDGGSEEPAVEVEEQAEAASAEPAAPEPAPVEAAAAEPAPEPQPILVAAPTDDAEAKLADIASKKDALMAQFDEGDITTREYQKQLDELMKAERQVEFSQHEAQLAAKMEQQRLQNEWTATCNSFVESNPVYKDNPRLYKALDAEVRDLAARPDTASWTGQKFLEEAHKALRQAFNLPDGAKAKPQARELPPNLAKVPASNVEDTNGGRFAVLDRMAASDPLGYEETLSKMSDADRNAYLSS